MLVFRKRGRERDRDRERNIDVREKQQSVASVCALTADRTHNLGMCPDWESNRQPFSLQAGTQSAEPHRPGPDLPFCNNHAWYLSHASLCLEGLADVADLFLQPPHKAARCSPYLRISEWRHGKFGYLPPWGTPGSLGAQRNPIDSGPWVQIPEHRCPWTWDTYGRIAPFRNWEFPPHLSWKDAQLEMGSVTPLALLPHLSDFLMV